MRQFFVPLLALPALAGCVTPTGPGFSALSSARATTVDVPTDGYETYVTQHNGFTRVRRSNTATGDAAILAQFEDSNPASPAGFRSLVLTQPTNVASRVNAEIIVEGSTQQVIQRVLRLTTDVQALSPAAVAAAGGEIVLAGSDYSIVRVGGAAARYAGQSDPGALYLALNFDTQTAAIRILNRQLYFHTPQSQPLDQWRIDLLGENLPFNTQTGAFGGTINGEVHETVVHMGGYTIPVSGTVLGQVGGSSATALVAGGVFQASGTGMGFGQPQDMHVEGVFWAAN